MKACPITPASSALDIGLPGMSGIECVLQLKATLPATQFVMLTAYDDSESVYEKLHVNARAEAVLKLGLH